MSTLRALLCSLTILLQLPLPSVAVEPSDTDSQSPIVSSAPFEAFTGKVTKNKVRLRQQPSLDSPVVRELKQGDLLIVTGETDEYFAVQSPSDVKGFVFRTYVLDNVVEANRVNVRIAPDVDAPIIGQLNAGESVNGTISANNNKWLEIAPPSSTRFFVSKDYIQNIGDVSKMAAIEKRREEVNTLLNSALTASQTEMLRSFPEINLDPIYANYHKVIDSYQDFPEQVASAQDQLSTLQGAYLQKKLAFLESKTRMAQNDWQNKNTELTEQVNNQQQQLKQLEKKLQRNKSHGNNNQETIATNGPANKMSFWQPAEQEIFSGWQKQHPEATIQDFYQAQQDNAVTLSGIIEPYTRVVKNKPGDYVVINPQNNLPIAFIYSTQVDLQDKVGKNVVLHGAPRSNNNFAYPAYFVLSNE